MTVYETLKETAMINSSLKNLGIYNEGIVSNAVSGIIKMIQNFINWIQTKIIPMFQKLGAYIRTLLEKTKVGRNFFAKRDAKKKAKQDAADEERRKKEDEEDELADANLAKMRRDVLAYPRWINYLANSVLVPGRVMKIANSTEDRTDDIVNLTSIVNKHIVDGQARKKVVGFDNFRAEAKEQLEILLKGTEMFRDNCGIINHKLEVLKNSLQGTTGAGSEMRMKNTSNLIQLMTKKYAECLKVSTEGVKTLEKAIDIFKM